MGLVGVLAKAVSASELEMAASGGIPPRLGGGTVGSHGVARGIEGDQRYPFNRGHGSIEPSRAYHRAMSGGDFPAPEGDPLAPEEGHQDRLAEILAHIQELDESRAAEPRPWESSPRGGSLGRALGRGGDKFMTEPMGELGGRSGGIGNMVHGTRTADIPGTVELPPWVRENEMSSDRMLEGDEKAQHFLTSQPPEEERHPPAGPQGRGSGIVGVSGQGRLDMGAGADVPPGLRGINLNALPPNFRAKLPDIAASMADRPRGTGHRRQE